MPRDSIDRLLPRTRLLDLDGVERDLRRGRGPQVVVVCAEDDADAAYLHVLAAAAEELREWGARIFGIVPDRADARADDGAVTWLLDPEAEACSGTMVLVTDEWGEVYFTTRGADDARALPTPAARALPTPEEIVDWVRFAAIQCPECENPEGAWRDL